MFSLGSNKGCVEESRFQVVDSYASVYQLKPFTFSADESETTITGKTHQLLSCFPLKATICEPCSDFLV
ncbi:hypothetical protein HOLleu_28324 [Holothuria leucospilota]|uniref:Uncharacterized protein n=1 Tax=Holothuria leucospilota TaxID=206669 RepID=A0A9Q1BM15_HOLLE|nr:hypothetical protein HOLleu_28324 [Holothuria leucospilota]